MHDPEDLKLYRFAGKLAEKLEGTYLHIELPLLVAEGRADLESRIQPIGEAP